MFQTLKAMLGGSKDHGHHPHAGGGCCGGHAHEGHDHGHDHAHDMKGEGCCGGAKAEEKKEMAGGCCGGHGHSHH
jgi:FKBP-type peptidyl-prolyl cis-trans isomerase SlyD